MFAFRVLFNALGMGVGVLAAFLIVRTAAAGANYA
jgi:hypothetical protein